MGKRKRVFNIKKLAAVFLSVILLMGMNGNQFMLEVQADEGTPTVMWHFDDRGNPDEGFVFVSVNEQDSVSVKSEECTEYGNGNYRVHLDPPEGREECIPVIDIRIYDGETLKEILSNCDFFDEVNGNESGPNLSKIDDYNFSFDFSNPNTNVDVNIWWSEYDRVGGWYDSSTGDGKFCVEVCGNGGGEAYLEGVNDYPVIWEYTGVDEENNQISWGGQKILVPAQSFAGGNTVKIKFCSYEGFSFGRFEINGPEGFSEPIFEIDAADLQQGEEAECQLSMDWFTEDNWYHLNSNLSFDEGMPTFNINYDDHNGGKLMVGGTDVPSGELTDFLFGGTYEFTLCPPDNRKEGCSPIVEVCMFGEPDSFSSTEDGSLTVIDSKFTVTLPAEADFRGVDVNIWWSEFDKLSANDEEYCLIVSNDSNGDAYFEVDDYPNTFEYKDSSERGYGAQKFIIPRSAFNDGVGPVLNAHAYEGFSFDSIEVNGDEKEAPDGKYTLKSDDFSDGGFANANIRFSGGQGGERIVNYYAGENGTLSFAPNFEANRGEDGDEWYHGTTSAGELSVTITPNDGYKIDKLLINNGDETSNVVDGVYTWTLTDGDNNLEVSFKQGGAAAADKFEGFITSQNYLYGDWDMDGDVDTDDLKLGIAQQIYFKGFKDDGNTEIRQAYPEITSYDEFSSMINITIGDHDTSGDITATAQDGSTYTIPAYTYRFTFTDSQNPDRNVNAEGVAWLFKFDGDSYYATDTLNDVVMTISDGATNTYFLRNNAKDPVDPVSGQYSGEGSLSAVGNYKVEFDNTKNSYIREVGIFGNGSSLDNFLMTEDSETEMCTYQGRNEMFVNDAKNADSKERPVIFGKFSFYRSDFTGMKIQGAGAAGNTPAWSFATDPIWGSDDEAGTEKEAIVYFGNNRVIIKPVTINGAVSEISDIKKVDTTIPDSAVKIIKDNNIWEVDFFTNFYDEVELKVTYATDGEPKTEYIKIHRVGIDIEATSGGNADEAKTLFHGTENGPSYTPDSNNQTMIYATYYYPESGGTNKLVDLYATFTWKDGSVTKSIISNSSSLNLEFHHDGTADVQSSDFILYEGSKADAPQKIEVSAVVSGFEGATSFTGMRLGAGKGVCWNNNIGN